MAEGIDYARLAQELMQVLSTGASLRPDHPYRSKDPGTTYRSGELTSDVGWLDPVDMLAGLLASKGASLLRGTSRALPRPGQPTRDFAREAAEKVGATRAAQEAEDAASLARRQQEIDAALQERLKEYADLEGQSRAYRAQLYPEEPAPAARHIIRDLGTGKDIPQPGKRPEPGHSQDYAEIIRTLFAHGGQ